MGRALKSKQVNYGRNSDATESDSFVRCSRCGFWCDTSRDMRVPDGSHAGWGMKYSPYYVITTITNGVKSTIKTGGYE